MQSFDIYKFSTDYYVSKNKKIKFTNMVDRSNNIILFGLLLHNFKNGQLVELSIFEYSVLFVINGHHKFDLFYSVYNNKIDTFKQIFIHNPQLIQKINENLINPKFIATIPNPSLFPERWKEIVKKQEKIEQKKNEKITTNIYTCPRCKGKNCQSHIIQTRASDEALTTIINCLDCGQITKF